MKKLFRILAAGLAGTVIYVLFSFIFGQDGIWVDGQMREQKRLLISRTDEIQKINDDLELEYTALEKDPDVISAFARKLGFVHEGEKIVKINGLMTTDEFHFETGTAIKAANPVSLPECVCKIAGILMFAVAYLYLLWIDFRNRVPEKKNKVNIKGIPIYDLPQV